MSDRIESPSKWAMRWPNEGFYTCVKYRSIYFWSGSKKGFIFATNCVSTTPWWAFAKTVALSACYLRKPGCSRALPAGRVIMYVGTGVFWRDNKAWKHLTDDPEQKTCDQTGCSWRHATKHRMCVRLSCHVTALFISHRPNLTVSPTSSSPGPAYHSLVM